MAKKVSNLLVTILIISFFFLSAITAYAGPGDYIESDPIWDSGYSETTVTGHSRGNHELDCTIIRPWGLEGPDDDDLYPVIVWANGWCYNNVFGDSGACLGGYKPGLIEWALDGSYIVIAANQWSVQESDVLQCLQWIVDQNTVGGSDYEGVVNTRKIGLAGHSQGGGAIIKAGDGEPNGFDITATVAMNPYGPAWVRSGKQDGPMMLIGGSNDTTTPTASFGKVWQAIQSNGQGGLLAELQGGTHNDDAWAPEGENPEDHNFGCYQEATELWWQIYLNDSGSLSDLVWLLEDDTDDCDWDYSSSDG